MEIRLFQYLLRHPDLVIQVVLIRGKGISSRVQQMLLDQIRIGINGNKIRALLPFRPLCNDLGKFLPDIIHAEPCPSQLHAGGVVAENARDQIKGFKIMLNGHLFLDHRVLLQLKIPFLHLTDPIPFCQMPDQLLQEDFIFFQQADLIFQILAEHIQPHFFHKQLPSFKSQLDMGLHTDLHQKIKDLVDQLEIIPGIFFFQLDHHVIGEEVPKAHIFKVKPFLDITELFPHVKPEQIGSRADIDDPAPVSFHLFLPGGVDLHLLHNGVGCFRGSDQVGGQILLHLFLHLAAVLLLSPVQLFRHLLPVFRRRGMVAFPERVVQAGLIRKSVVHGDLQYGLVCIQQVADRMIQPDIIQKL